MLTGASPLATGIATGLVDRGAQVAPVDCSFTSEDEIATAIAAAERALGGLDQVVHTWLAPSLVTPRLFTDLDEAAWVDGCERSMEAAWWLARRVAAPLSSAAGVTGVRGSDHRDVRRRELLDARSHRGRDSSPRQSLRSAMGRDRHHREHARGRAASLGRRRRSRSVRRVRFRCPCLHSAGPAILRPTSPR